MITTCLLSQQAFNSGESEELEKAKKKNTQLEQEIDVLSRQKSRLVYFIDELGCFNPF